MLIVTSSWFGLGASRRGVFEAATSQHGKGDADGCYAWASELGMQKNSVVLRSVGAGSGTGTLGGGASGGEGGTWGYVGLFRGLSFPQMTRDEILTKVRAVLVDALAVDGDEVELGSVLTADLGAESIDFLDIVFKLEQVFGIKIPQGELFPENLAQDPRYVQSGKLTAEGLDMLKLRLPHVDFSGFEADPILKKVGTLFTVETLVKFVEGKLSKM